MNRAIKVAHAQMLKSHRRRLESFTNASRQIRDVVGYRILNYVDRTLSSRSSVSIRADGNVSFVFFTKISLRAFVSTSSSVVKRSILSYKIKFVSNFFFENFAKTFINFQKNFRAIFPSRQHLVLA